MFRSISPAWLLPATTTGHFISPRSVPALPCDRSAHDPTKEQPEGAPPMSTPRAIMIVKFASGTHKDQNVPLCERPL
ncbi:hypothetical protein B0T14DRAFT_518471 [Immersiella caudata]|uniref:Uncharacterized protein n=1 Tax=Immersiella caudata TaxID=314043 RepID=A0AA39WPK1_9PEZI|nr:hypothetical protein B0T14DRAFT_518471 [Immersiella caudata]